MPRHNRCFVKSYREAATIDQRMIVCRPITDPIMEDRGLFWHTPILATTSSEGNLQQRPFAETELASLRRPDHLNHTMRSVQPDAVAVLEPSGGVLHVGERGQAVLARNRGGVREHAPNLDDHP